MNQPAQPAPSKESLKLCEELYENGHIYSRNGEYILDGQRAGLILDRHYAALRARCERLEGALKEISVLIPTLGMNPHAKMDDPIGKKVIWNTQELAKFYLAQDEPLETTNLLPRDRAATGRK